MLAKLKLYTKSVVLVRLKMSVVCHTKCCRTSIITFIKIILIVYCPFSVEGKRFLKTVDGNSVQFTVHVYIISSNTIFRKG